MKKIKWKGLLGRIKYTHHKRFSKPWRLWVFYAVYTTVKPSGTVSLVGTTSDIEPFFPNHRRDPFK